ncbi:hypothetical protein HIM_04504 [Hirsutella minnesotensis 3608]|uniref:Nudix hydrolase domain-containing protein n=1 Tax=Hirsutella minnesotensis 3608 TaxID=1043627 RepID=A0A0F7ZV60_9HYPO|nr:hypothetical protein HIM_04504 [Hirsutella minnesotensis 3608]
MAGTQMQLEDWLDDLCVRFIINLPQEDLSSVARICFQVEEAQWFYEDFIRPLDPTLPSMSLRIFCLRIFQHCPLLASFSVENHTKAFEEFLQYKTRVPVRGAIMLNQAMDSVVLVKGWKKGASWSFPRGKINKDESDLDCAIREVYEETGLDLHAAGLVPTEKKPKYIEISMREQQLRLYVFRDIPMDTDFQPRTRKEISKIQWYKLSELPAFRKKGDRAAQNHDDHATAAQANKFYMVAPFLVPLKKWIAAQRKADEKRILSGMQAHHAQQLLATDEVQSTEDDAWATDQPFAPGPVAAINTLDGATQELARLLKMQPPAQGIQAPPREDKGSALLSILQADSHPSREQMQTPQARTDLAVASSPQPRNPHHHTNQRPTQPSIYASEPLPFLQPLPDHTVDSVHPFSTHTAAMPPNLDSIMGQLKNVHMNQTVQAPVEPLLHQGMDFMNRGLSGVYEPKYSPADLNGQSMALLNALTRNRTPVAPSQTFVERSNQRASPARAPSQDAVHPAPAHGGNALYQKLANQSARHVSLPHVTVGVTGPSAGSRSDDHRSALLDMFKKTVPESAISGAADTSQRTFGNMQIDKSANKAPKMSQALQSRLSETRTVSLDHGSARAQAAQHGWAGRQEWENIATYKQAPAPAPGHPTRILQRGQVLNDNEHRPSHTGPLHDQQPHELVGRPGHSMQQKALAPVGEGEAKTVAPDAQKRQLLSLFGKQPVSATEPSQDGNKCAQTLDEAMASGNGEGPLGASQSTSSRRATETPMSPADQSFLLEYLQAVTNNASR